MSYAPQLFLGRVMHRRLRPRVNDFAYPVFYIHLPLNDLKSAKRSVFSIDRGNLLSFHQRDHGPRDGSPLLSWMQSQLRQHGLPDDGDIVLQTFPRVLGYVFNPVSFWFCRNRKAELIAIMAEVNNTFGGHHHYLLHNPDATPLRDEQLLLAEKALHVSPFCDVVGSYRFRFHLEGAVQSASIDYADAEGELLLTSISGRLQPWSVAALLGAFLRMPLLTFGVMARIHWQALKLWMKRVPFVGTHPPSEPQALHQMTK